MWYGSLILSSESKEPYPVTTRIEVRIAVLNQDSSIITVEEERLVHSGDVEARLGDILVTAESRVVAAVKAA